MTANEKFLTQRQRYQAVTLPQDFSDEEMARDWTLSSDDQLLVAKYRKSSRLFFAIQLCAIRLYGRFLLEASDVSPRILSYLNSQLELPPSLTIEAPEREATYLSQRKDILNYLSFQKYGTGAESRLSAWLFTQANKGRLPEELFSAAERFLLNEKVMLPGPSVLERLIIRVCNDAHDQVFDSLHEHLPDELKAQIDGLLRVPAGDQRSLFYLLKEFPPSASVHAMQRYLERYRVLNATGINAIEGQLADPAFIDYLYRLTKRYSAKDLKRFNDKKR